MTTTDLYRKYLDKGYREAYLYKSSQTNYLHFHQDCFEGSPAQACPTEENFLFALLLLRKKTHESVQEGKERLQALLSFQNNNPSLPQYGNFPPYLTGLPRCQDWVLPLRIALILTTALKYFSSILGRDLEQNLVESLNRLLAVTEENMTKIRFPNLATVLHLIVLNKGREEVIAAIDAFFLKSEGLSPDACGKVVAACALYSSDVYSYAVQKASSLWNSRQYVGPPWGVFSYQAGIEVTLFDLLMSLHSDLSLVSKPWSFATSLECAMLPPEMPDRIVFQDTVTSSSGSVRMWNDRDVFFSVALCPPRPIGLHGFYPIRVVTPFTTICVNTPGGQLIDVTEKNGEAIFTVLVDQISEDDPSIFRLWIDRQKSVSLRMDGQIGSVFDPQRGLQITDGDVSFLLTMQSSLSLVGRISLGNRPSQLCRHRKGTQEACDWKVCAEYVRGGYPDQYTMRLVRLS